ncbi:ROK family protein [Lactiplantibacillus plantarum]|uniref:ROK family protein n=1 Tax=Lactiplantibacillus plantarum TaxID=1590 RepID=UPI0006AD63ED|nr:ROK family protein [Lactiplantibacillus plantarum]ALC08602.1 hypothetical protein JM48_1394 [Lactiplantibacillus plantarum]MBP5832848.1 ROK family protein [Lactiplantibacillus plantarum]QAR89130.1 ROK family protein [Lactiplantibacillus plantarum]WKF82522.1 ROK family protein [Lactiplantibacillus plantarum]WKF87651.1 ROK family protein [Lactiplantibacillus plantarum]
MKKKYLSVDVGGTRLKYGLIDENGTLLATGDEATPTNNLDGFLRTLFGIARRYQQQASGIAISIPGKVDQRHSVIYNGGSLPYLDGLPLAHLLKQKFGLPVTLENDGKCTALGEYWQGNLRDKPNSGAIVLGTAVGGGLILDGKIRAGTHLQSGEVSFMIDPAQTQRIVMGDQCSAVKLINQLAKHFDLMDINDGKTAFKYLEERHDLIANQLLVAYCRRVASMILNIQAITDLTNFVIGGGISQQPSVVATINQEYDYWLEQYPSVRDTVVRPEILAAKLGNSANLLGALYRLLN